MTERTYTQAELQAVAARLGGREEAVLQKVFTQLAHDEEAARILASQPPRPLTIPDDFKRIGVDSLGYNIGRYIIADGDRHIWLPPEEACKERPNLSLGIFARA